jgi:hypothetical protein
MTPVRPKPRRQLRHELYSLASVLAIPAAISLVFPYEAVNFEPEECGSGGMARCAFVELTEGDEAAALASARAAWKVGASSVRNLWADLTVAAMPEETPSPVMDVSERTRVAPAAVVKYDVPPMPRTMAAPAPGRISAGGGADGSSAFPRDEMMALERKETAR